MPYKQIWIWIFDSVNGIIYKRYELLYVPIYGIISTINEELARAGAGLLATPIYGGHAYLLSGFSVAFLSSKKFQTLPWFSESGFD